MRFEIFSSTSENIFCWFTTFLLAADSRGTECSIGVRGGEWESLLPVSHLRLPISYFIFQLILFLTFEYFIKINDRSSSTWYSSCDGTLSCRFRLAVGFSFDSRHSGVESIFLTLLSWFRSASVLFIFPLRSAISFTIQVFAVGALFRCYGSSIANFFLLPFGLFRAHLFDLQLLQSFPQWLCCFEGLFWLSFFLTRFFVPFIWS